MKKAAAGQRHSAPGPLLVRTRRLLRQSGLRARKGLGQHFLVDDSVLEVILATGGLTPEDVVIEVGSGLGVLTGELAGRAGGVIAVEIDGRLVALLAKEMSSFSNVVIVNQDILEVDPADLLREHQGKFPPAVDMRRYKVVANLPYYITSPVLRHFLEARVKPQAMLVMVQKEVAEQICAAPGRMSLLSIGVQLYGEPEIVGYVPAAGFYPAPEVDSAVLRIKVRRETAVAVADEESFFRLVRAGFSAVRKQVANSLAGGLGWPKDEVLPLLEEAGIVPRRRAETMTLEEWERLWQLCIRAGKAV